MKIAVVHDYFTQLGGAERVAEGLYQMLPNAELYSTVALKETVPPGLRNVRIRTSWMQSLPAVRKFYRAYFLLYPFGVRSLDLSNYDLVITSSSGYVKGVNTRPDTVHVCYCHTPMRWVWSFDSYSSRGSRGPLKRLILPSMIAGLRLWDKNASRQPDHFIANSQNVAERIRLAYDRIAEVIPPPIDSGRFCPVSEEEDYYLVLSRLVSYKSIDLAVEACSRLGRRLLVIGEGPDRMRLSRLGGPTVRFMGRLSDSEVEYHAARCRALLFPGEEDFGMAPLEVAAAGRPTIAFRAGGALETILDGETGLFFDEPTPESLIQAIERFETMEWNKRHLTEQAARFSSDMFRQRMYSFLARIGVPVPEAVVADTMRSFHPVRSVASASADPSLTGATA